MMTETVMDVLNGIEGLPVPVKLWKVETGPDSTGDDSVTIVAVLRDDEADWEYEKRERIREMVWDAVRGKAGYPEPWVYITFQSESEQDYVNSIDEDFGE